MFEFGFSALCLKALLISKMLRTEMHMSKKIQPCIQNNCEPDWDFKIEGLGKGNKVQRGTEQGGKAGRGFNIIDGCKPLCVKDDRLQRQKALSQNNLLLAMREVLEPQVIEAQEVRQRRAHSRTRNFMQSSEARDSDQSLDIAHAGHTVH
eukprot:1159268-Pelagomonas_calceolata.AAC.4